MPRKVAIPWRIREVREARDSAGSDPWLVVSAAQMVVYVLKGHDFSRAANGLERARL